MAKTREDINGEFAAFDFADSLPEFATGVGSEAPRHRTPQAVAAGDVARGAVQRSLAAVGMSGIALIHLLDLPGKLEETPYLGVAYCGLIAMSMVLAGAFAHRESRRMWLAAGGLAAATFLGYCVNRIWGMPGAMDDVGNWLEPLGLASLFVEAGVVTLSAAAFRRLRG